MKAVGAVQRGEYWFGRAALLEALRSQLTTERLPVPFGEGCEALTPRERDIMALAATSMSNKEIALELSISDQTVETHLHRIYVKLHKSGRSKLFLADARTLRMTSSRTRVPVSAR